MPNHSLNLTKHQQQVLSDLEIDAWYLQPLTNQSDDSQQAAISDIVETLSASLKQDNNTIEPLSEPVLAANSLSTLATSHHSVHQAIAATKNTNENCHVNPSEVKTQSEVSSVTSPLSNNPLPPSIELVAIHHVPPSDDHIVFPEVERLADNSWQGIGDALNQLNTKSNLTNELEKVDVPFGSGLGIQHADWLFIMPPSRHDDSHQCLSLSSKSLMAEWLKSLGKSFDEVYITPMVKQLTKIPRDPDDELLVSHLSILLTEIGLVKPKRIFLMGRLPCQKLLGSSTPLSELMKRNYELDCPDEIFADVIALTCLPSLDYFCKLPSEKSWLWQASKKLSQST